MQWQSIVAQPFYFLCTTTFSFPCIDGVVNAFMSYSDGRVEMNFGLQSGAYTLVFEHFMLGQGIKGFPVPAYKRSYWALDAFLR